VVRLWQRFGLGFTVPKKLPFLPDEHHYAIAHVATRAAQLDHAIELCVSAQMGSHRKAAEHLIKNLDTHRLVDLLRVLLQDNFPTRVSEIETLIQEIKAARAERNEVLHWLWVRTQIPQKQSWDHCDSIENNRSKRRQPQNSMH
jgi:hypothetical protein